MKKCTRFQTWKTLVNNSFTAFFKVWWRMAVVNLSVFAIIITSFLLAFVGVVFGVFGSLQELGSFLANQQFGGEMDALKFSFLFVVVILVFLAIIIGGTLGKVSNWMIIGNFINKKDKNPFKTYFVDSWQFLGKYLWLGLKVLFYILWPIVLGAIVISLFVILIETSEIEYAVALISSLILIIFTIFRVFRIIFAPAFMIATKKNTKEAWEASIKMVEGNWWYVFITMVSFVIMIYAPLFVFDFSDYLMSFGWDFSIVNFKDLISNTPQIYSPSFFVLLKSMMMFFVVAPLVTLFMYFLMLDLVAKKKIKM
jgi:hypothetical protein